MNIFIGEYLFYASYMVSGLLCLVLAVLYSYHYFKRNLKTSWRALATLSLATVFLVNVLIRLNPELSTPLALLESLSFLAFLLGMILEPIGLSATIDKNLALSHKFFKKSFGLFLSAIVFFVLFDITIFSIISRIFDTNTSLEISIRIGTAVILIASALVRSRVYKKIKSENRLTIWENIREFMPFLCFIFLLLQTLLQVVITASTSVENSPFARLSIEYGLFWYLTLGLNVLAFVSLALWSTKFINSAKSVKTLSYIILSSIVTSLLLSLLLTFVIFRLVESNKYESVRNALGSQVFLLNDRLEFTNVLSNQIADDKFVVQSLELKDWEGLDSDLEFFKESTIADIIKVYTLDGDVVFDSNISDSFILSVSSELLSNSLSNSNGVSSFGIISGSLTDYLVARSIQPVYNNDIVLGFVEVAFIFDNSFVQLLEEQTGFDSIIFTGNKISVSTIISDGSIENWIGTFKTDEDVLTNTLINGNTTFRDSNFFNEVYNSGYIPIKNYQNEPIGMLFAGAPMNATLMSSRSQLVLSYVILTTVVLVVSITFAVIAGLRITRKRSSKAF